MLSEEMKKELHKESRYNDGKLQYELVYYLKPISNVIKEIEALEKENEMLKKQQSEKADDLLNKSLKIFKQIIEDVEDQNYHDIERMSNNMSKQIQEYINE
jgi:hypothetical protein